MRPERLVARYGLSSDLPVLVLAEIAYDVDTKTARIGDDTANASKVITSKSVGEVEYSSNLVLKFGRVDIHDGKTVDGVDISELNKATGFVVRGATSNTWAQRILENDDYITIEHADGVDGNPKIKASEKLLSAINAKKRYTYGEEPPKDAFPGDFFYSVVDETVYMRLADSENDNEHWWLDITSLGGGNSGSRFFVSALPPKTSSLGDEWYDAEEERIYKRVVSAGHACWVEMRV